MSMASEGQRKALQYKMFSCFTSCIGIHPAVRFKVGDEELYVSSGFIPLGFTIAVCGAQNFILHHQNMKLKHLRT